MYVTPAGISIERREVQLKKASCPILVTLAGRSMAEREVHP